METSTPTDEILTKRLLARMLIAAELNSSEQFAKHVASAYAEPKPESLMRAESYALGIADAVAAITGPYVNVGGLVRHAIRDCLPVPPDGERAEWFAKVRDLVMRRLFYVFSDGGQPCEVDGCVRPVAEGSEVGLCDQHAWDSLPEAPGLP